MRRFLYGGAAAVALTAAACTTPPPPPPDNPAGPNLPTTLEQADDLPGYNIFRPTDLDATGGPLPVVIFGGGGCFRTDIAWHPLLERIAAAGNVVVSIDVAPGGSPLDTYTSADQAAAIDWAEQQDGSGSAFDGHLDLDGIVASGNSCGGVTSLELASNDDRVDSVFVLSGSSGLPGTPPEQSEAIIDGIDAPIAFAVGGPEDISRENAQRDIDLADHIPAYMAARASADHLTVSTDGAILYEVGDIAINWIEFTLHGSDTARASLESNPCNHCEPDVWTPQARNFDLVG